MFGNARRHKPKPHPPPLTLATADPYAARAASAVYKPKPQPSRSSLPEAAAAAALRARPTTPINVANVATKRTLRRSASHSSSSAPTALQPGQLLQGRRPGGGHKRRGSNASMTERTFRTPSPHGARPSTSGGLSPSGSQAPHRRGRSEGAIPGPHPPHHPPPVPALPEDVAETGSILSFASSLQSLPQARPQKQQQRQQRQQEQQQRRRQTFFPNMSTNSLGMRSTPLRLGSQKLRQEGAASWFGAAKVGGLATARQTDPAMASPPSSPHQILMVGDEQERRQEKQRLPALEQDADGGETPQSATTDGSGRPGSRSSVNFSYPGRMRVGSPPVSPIDTRTSMEFPASSAQQSMASQQPRHDLQQVKSPRRQPNTKRLSLESVASSIRLATRSSRSTSAPPVSLVYDPNSRRMVPRADFLALEEEMLEAREQEARTQQKKRHQPPPRAGSHLAKGTMGRTQVHTQKSVPVQQSKTQVQPAKAITPQASGASLSSQAAVTNTSRPVMSQLAQATTATVPVESPAWPVVQITAPSPKTDPQEPGRQGSRGQSAQQEAAQPGSAAVSDVAVESPSRESGRQNVRRQPSVVTEEPEPEDNTATAGTNTKRRSVSEALDAVPSRLRVYRPPLSEYSARTRGPPNDPAAKPRQASMTRPAESLALARATTTRQATEEAQAPVSGSTAPTTITPTTTQDVRFGPVQDGLMVRHDPPSRSISPRKSAMKQQDPSRGASPSDDTNTSDGHGAPDEQQQQPSSTALQRKKSVRVSFDDVKTPVMGESASSNAGRDSPDGLPFTHSPHTTTTSAGRRPWYSSLRGNRKDAATGGVSAQDEDDGVVMKPRPALPSFGSVRDRKPREQSPEEEPERPLVRPNLVVPASSSPSLPASPELPPVAGPAAVIEPLSLSSLAGPSSDDAIGALLLARERERDATATATVMATSARNEANASARSRDREPLPPIVTSIEGTGFESPTDSSSTGIMGTSPSGRGAEVMGASSTTNTSNTAAAFGFGKAVDTPARGDVVGSQRQAQAASMTRTGTPPSRYAHPQADKRSMPENQPQPHPALPAIATASRSAATANRTNPSADQLDRTKNLSGPIPGDFPSDDNDESSKTSEASAATAEGPVLPPAGSMDTTQKASAPAESSSDESESIYSDAYEDLSDAEGDGFLSLDAMVQPGRAPTSKPEAPAQYSWPAVPGGREPPRLASEISTATTAVEMPTQPVEFANVTSSTDTGIETPASPADWEQAKAFWRTLTAEKRAQLAREVTEDAGVEADLEGDKQGGPTKTKKKSIERRNSERKILAVHMAQQMMAQQEQLAQEQQNRQPQASQPQPKRQDQRHFNQRPSGADLTARQYMVQPRSKREGRASPSSPELFTLRTTLRAGRPRQQTTPAQRTATAGGELQTTRMRRSMRSGSASQPPARPAATPRAGIPSTARAQAPGGPPAHAYRVSEDLALTRPLERRGSTGSVSSFRRNRSSSTGPAQAGPSASRAIRRSMRQSSPGPLSMPTSMPADAGPGKRFSLRALSPGRRPFRRSSTTSPPARPATAVAGGASSSMMRGTMRGSSVESSNRRGLGGGSGGGGGIFGLGGSGFGRNNAAAKAQRIAIPRRTSSRFDGWSDGEDGPIRRASGGFRSRFADSSDDEEAPVPQKQPPVSLVLPPSLLSRPVGDGPGPSPGRATLRSKSSAASTALPEELEESEELRDSSVGDRASPPPAPAGTGPRQLQSQVQRLASPNRSTRNPAKEGQVQDLATVRCSLSGRGNMRPRTAPMHTTTVAPGFSQRAQEKAGGTVHKPAENSILSRPSATPKRPSFMSVLRRRKGPSDSSNIIARSGVTESAARRDTKLERTPEQLRVIRSRVAGALPPEAQEEEEEEEELLEEERADELYEGGAEPKINALPLSDSHGSIQEQQPQQEQKIALAMPPSSPPVPHGSRLQKRTATTTPSQSRRATWNASSSSNSRAARRRDNVSAGAGGEPRNAALKFERLFRFPGRHHSQQAQPSEHADGPDSSFPFGDLGVGRSGIGEAGDVLAPAPQRPAISGNLGTRTMSMSGASGGGGGSTALGLFVGPFDTASATGAGADVSRNGKAAKAGQDDRGQRQQQQKQGLGQEHEEQEHGNDNVIATDAGAGGHDAGDDNILGSATASKKKKKFGALRRMLRLDD